MKEAVGVSGLSWIGQGDKVLWKLKGFGVREAQVFHEWRGRLQALYMEIGNISRYDIQLQQFKVWGFNWFLNHNNSHTVIRMSSSLSNMNLWGEATQLCRRLCFVSGSRLKGSCYESHHINLVGFIVKLHKVHDEHRDVQSFAAGPPRLIIDKSK